MKKILALLFAGFFLVLAGQTRAAQEEKMSLSAADNVVSKIANADLAGIKEAVGLYLQAAPDGDSKTAEKAFATWATMSWNENGVLKTVPIQVLYDYFDEKKRPASGEIVTCDVAGDVAIVRLESDFDGVRFSDMFTLVKDGNAWKIVSKVYHVKN